MGRRRERERIVEGSVLMSEGEREQKRERNKDREDSLSNMDRINTQKRERNPEKAHLPKRLGTKCYQPHSSIPRCSQDEVFMATISARLSTVNLLYHPKSSTHTHTQAYLGLATKTLEQMNSGKLL